VLVANSWLNLDSKHAFVGKNFNSNSLLLMLDKNEENIIEAATLQAMDREVWTVDKLASAYGVSKEEIQRWMADPMWDDVLQAKENRIILETRYSQLKSITSGKMIALNNITSLIAKASTELKEKVGNGEISALEALDKTRGLCNAQESGDKTLETVLSLEDAMFGISQILAHISEENEN
jgi:hypothetical protein